MDPIEFRTLTEKLGDPAKEPYNAEAGHDRDQNGYEFELAQYDPLIIFLVFGKLSDLLGVPCMSGICMAQKQEPQKRRKDFKHCHDCCALDEL